MAGLVMAERRFVSDPFHHDTVVMNAAWTFYNIVILSVAASVAWEKKQRRSQVRVHVRLPLTLLAPGGTRVAGNTAQLSTRGAMVYLDHGLPLAPGWPVVLALNGKGSHCEIPARVIHSCGARLHLLFPQLSLQQERYLVTQVYSRPEAWLAWHSSRPSDRPLRSLAHIVWLALRGMVVVFLGFFTRRPVLAPEALPGRQREQRASRVAAGLMLALLLSLIPAPLRAGANNTNTTNAPETQPSVHQPEGRTAAFHDQYNLGTLANQAVIALRGPGSTQNFFLNVRLTKVISAATLDLRYTAPLLRAGESSLELWLNGTPVGSVAVAPGSQRAELWLPTDLLTTENTLTIQLHGGCANCRDGRAPWVTIDPTSEVHLSGARLPLANDLALLPVPFFDSAGQRPWSLPVVFSNGPGMHTLEAAAVVTSWFGIFSDFRGVRFPVSVGELPEGDAVVFALRNSGLAARLSLPSKPGALIAVRENPRDPYGKLLILAGDQPKDLVTAARALVTRNNAQAHTDIVYVNPVAIPARRQYDAPRWLDTHKPAPIGMYTTAEKLTLNGSGAIDLYFRLPPDLFLRAEQSVPLLLKYSYAGVADGSRAALHIRLNDQDVDSIPLKPASSSVHQEESVRLRTDSLHRYTNKLTVYFDFGNSNASPQVHQYAAIGRDSSIDLRGLPHSAVLPSLELFTNSGYPFTAWPDLGRAAVLLSDAPTPAEYETLFGMMGFFGAQTGAPALHVTITDAAHLEEVQDRDLVLLGTTASQRLLAQCAASMPLDLTDLQVNTQPEPSPLLHPEWPFRSADRERLVRLLAARAPLAVVVEGFVSPFHRDRSVVAIVPQGTGSSDAVAAMFTPALDKGPIYGGVAVSQNARFQSFLVGTLAYHSGRSGLFQQIRILLVEHYFFIPAVALLCAFLIAAWLRSSTERIAVRRLAEGTTYVWRD